MQTDDPDAMLAQLLDSDLSELLSISYVVLANNQVTNRHIERVHDMPVQRCWRRSVFRDSGHAICCTCSRVRRTPSAAPWPCWRRAA